MNEPNQASFGDRVQVWYLNRSFSEGPTSETEKAWESIIPSELNHNPCELRYIFLTIG